ncbi:MAG: aminotransferase class I/II-fold pyridoxal phosphate-dependent enzyme [Flavobacteriaceae bacterium]|nr:aminotransferase class I/II-fold pyridoxal phosphate-dependent enzyme [Flavobacteriaceae bacterium]
MRHADRLQHVNEYYFSEKLREIQSLVEQGKPIINLGIGNPDLPPPPQAIEAMHQALDDVSKHGYQPYKGIATLRNAISAFYAKHYAVTLDPHSEILPLFGAKEGIMHLSMAYLNPGDAVLVPNPGYASYSAIAQLLETHMIHYDLTPENNWYPDFEQLEKMDLSTIKMMWVNYPNMPTGAKATTLLFEKLIAFGKKHDILIVNDNPYSFILTEKPRSILQVDGAKEVAVELNSLSKSFNMAGWRVGMLVGNQEIISNALKVKSNMDSGMLYGLQMGASAALEINSDWFEQQNQTYSRRRSIVWKIADKLGFTYDKSAEGFFVWMQLPNGIQSYDMADKLLYEHDIFVTPGSIFGSNGNHYVRFSLCINEEKLEEVLQRISS